MTGFATDYINQIATTLRDRYRSGFPILKELVQNADDAGAQALAFGYHAGHGIEADHMLLQGPALWVLNDGAFKESDARAIRSFGLNAKAGDAGAIGKFGLGMMQKKADVMGDEFVAALRAKLEGTAGAAQATEAAENAGRTAAAPWLWLIGAGALVGVLWLVLK